MAHVIITFKIMPKDPEQNLDKIAKKVELEIKQFGGNVGRIDKEPVGFGLVALKIIFSMNENLGSTDDMEEKIKEIKGVQGCDVVDVRRALG